ncbi:flagellar biosynthesis protein FlaG [Thermohalobacter berrensis]|uniref:Flagellar biosynthesis protein FlaG n=1 Tax=Thermohalobacter berrensis TaxID=99594 RepID=A0A419T4N1_9FIRM|nr:flagellar biosynthesis protein FlaG [Thermohalobacter berrensis]
MKVRIEGVSSPAVIQRSQSVSREDSGHVKKLDQDKSKEVEAGVVNNEENKKVSEDELIHAIEKANESVKIYDRRLEFSIHEKTKEIIVKVIDTNTDEVIREIPPKKILDMVAKMWELAGILVDEKV